MPSEKIFLARFFLLKLKSVSDVMMAFQQYGIGKMRSAAP